MKSPAAPVRLRRRIGRDTRYLLSNLRSTRVRFGRGCDIRPGLQLLIEGAGTVEVDADCVLDRGLVLAATPGQIRIGARTVLGHHVTVAAAVSVTIGADCLLAELVTIRDHDHAFATMHEVVREQGRVEAAVVIGDDVWVGAKATILKGVTIGDHAVVAAGAVVTREVPPCAVVAGVPARVLRYRQ